MKIEQFVEEFNKSQNKEAYVKKHVVNEYVPFERKLGISDLIAKKMTLDNGDLIKNTPMVYENFILSLIREYTDVELTPENNLADFNLIEKYGISDILATAIGRDAKAFNTVLDMVINDAIDNHNNIVNHLNLKSDNIHFILDKFQDVAKRLSQAHEDTDV